jgi:hypothetical protein
MMPSFKRRVATGTALALAIIPLAAVATAPASAATALGVAYCQGRSNAAISARLAVLAGDAHLVQSAKHLSPTNAAALSNLITSDESGLSALKTKIDGDTSLASCHADAMTIVTGYRVYVLVEPQVHLTIAADRISAVAETLRDVATRLETRLAQRKAQGKEVDPGAQDAVNDLNARVAAATAAVSGVPSQVLALTPAGYPANKATLQSARGALETARHDVVLATADAGRAVSLLR